MSCRPAARLAPVACLALVPGFAPPGTTAAPVPTHLMPKDPPLAFPTRVGTTWVYDEGGTDKTIVISRVEEKDGAKLVTTDCVGADGRRTPYMVLSVSEGGVSQVASGGWVLEPSSCVLKLPHRDGQTWDADTRREGRGRVATLTITWRRSAGPWEKVKVPAGEFTAARVDYEFAYENGWRGRSTCWYAHGVGPVRTDVPGSHQAVLKSFTPGKE